MTRPARSSGKPSPAVLELGLSPGEISSLAYHHSLQVERLDVKISFVECNAERAEYFARELSEQLDIPTPLVLSEFVPADLSDDDLVLTTFYHLSEVRKCAADGRREVPTRRWRRS